MRFLGLNEFAKGVANMIYTVVPVRNEEDKIHRTLTMLLGTQSDKILVVLNGCEDDSLEVVKGFDDHRIQWVYFNKPLGVDVPRAVGAWIALQEGAEGILFVDGDTNGAMTEQIDQLIVALKEQQRDMVLSNCYPENQTKSTMARLLLSFRKQLNIELGVFDTIGYAIPSHGPHGISRKFAETVGLHSLAIPPVSLALAIKNHLAVAVATSISSELLRSTVRDEYHASQIVKTLIGDCIEALQTYQEKERTRGYDGIIFSGYHKNRRFDLLNQFMEVFSVPYDPMDM